MLSQINSKKWLFTFLVVHLLVWTLTPALVRLNLPLDSLEGTTWGHQLLWGYDKNPFLNAWLTALAVNISHSRDFMIYLFSQLTIVTGLWAIWALGKKIIAPQHALISVMLLECIQYYNIAALDFNDNVLEMGIWPLIYLFFYKAIKKQTLINWILVGFFTALATLTKYFIVVLLLPMLLFLLANQEARGSLSKTNFYYGVLFFLLLIAPHFYWLHQNDYITLSYAMVKTNAPKTWVSHFSYAIDFSLSFIATILLPLIIFSLIFLTNKSGRTNSKKISLSRFDRQFLWFIGIGPFICTLLISIIAGAHLNSAWGGPLVTLWTLILLAYTQPTIKKYQFNLFVTLLFGLMALVVSIYSYSLITARDSSSANFPGKEMATYFSNKWRNQFNTALPYVAGPRWEAGNIAYYSPDKPAVYMEWDKKRSPWINDHELYKKGALYIWPTDKPAKEFPIFLRKTYPNLIFNMKKSFYWQRDKTVKPITISYTFLPPHPS